MARSPLVLTGAVVLAIGVGAGVAAVLLRTDDARRAHALPVAQSSVTDEPVSPQLGRQIFVRCQACHGLEGKGIAGNYPPLINSPMLAQADATQAISLVLTGVTRSAQWNGYMPPFAEQLDDREIAAVLTYARSQWTSQAAAITAEDVALVRRRGVKP